MRRWAIRAAGLLAVSVAVFGTETGVSATPAEETGEALFTQRCAACHDARGFGTRILARRAPAGQAELTKRANLPTPVVVAVVRNGLGSMPPIRKAEMDDRQLALIAAYLEGKE